MLIPVSEEFIEFAELHQTTMISLTKIICIFCFVVGIVLHKILIEKIFTFLTVHVLVNC